MRILFHSNAPWAGTGYGQQTAIFASRLRDLGHEVTISAFYGLQGQGSQWGGITVLPGGMDGYGNDIVAAHAHTTRAELVVVLADAWPMNPEVIKGLPAAMWMPVDCDRLGVADEKMLTDSGTVPVAMSRHGRDQLTAAGFKPLYIPHGVDPSVFQPPADRAGLRKSWGVDGRFVIGMNAANKDGVRKGYSEQFHAFARFRKDHPDALLLVHALPQMPNNQLNLVALAQRLGIFDHVKFSDQYAYVTGSIKPTSLAEWYGCLDVLSSCSYGEGFGIPIIEAQACGTPVIVTRGSAMTELAGPGWAVDGQPFWNPVHQADWQVPSIEGIHRAYDKAYRYAASKRAAAREFAMTYDADRVLLEHWKPALDFLADHYAGKAAGPKDGVQA